MLGAFLFGGDAAGMLNRRMGPSSDVPSVAKRPAVVIAAIEAITAKPGSPELRKDVTEDTPTQREHNG